MDLERGMVRLAVTIYLHANIPVLITGAHRAKFQLEITGRIVLAVLGTGRSARGCRRGLHDGDYLLSRSEILGSEGLLIEKSALYVPP